MNHNSSSPAPKSDLSPGSPQETLGQTEGAPAGTPVILPAGAFPETVTAAVSAMAGTLAISAASFTLPVKAICDVLTERRRQINEFGHTPEKDAALSITTMHSVVHRYTHGLADTVSAHGARSTMRAYAVRAAAALLAFIDRLDAEDAANG